MTVQESQERALIHRAEQEGRFADWVYYLSVRRDLDRLAALEGRIDSSDARGLLTYAVIRLAQDPEPAVSLIDRLNGETDPWLYYTLGKALLGHGKVKEALALAYKRLEHDTYDVTVLNLLAKYLVAMNLFDLARDVLRRSLRLNPHQDDLQELDKIAESRKGLSQPFILDIYPEYHPVSFYLPVYDVERYVRQAIEGIFGQNYPIEEILVVDDGSTDRSVEIAREYPVKILTHDENKGLAAARNTAFRHASGRFVGAIDTDAWPAPDFTKLILMDFENVDPRMSGAGGKLLETNQAAPPDKWRAKYLALQQGPVRKCTPEGLFGSNTILRKDAVLDVGGYDENYRTNAEDVGISRALRGAGYWFFYTPYAVAYHERRDTVSSVLRTMWNWVFPGKFEAGVYAEPYYLMMSIQRIREAVDYFIQNDLRDGDHDTLYIDVLALFYLSFLDLNFATRTGTIGAADARFVQEGMIDTLRELEGRHGPGLREKIAGDVAHIMQKEAAEGSVRPEFQTWMRIFAHDVQGTYQQIDGAVYATMLRHET